MHLRNGEHGYGAVTKLLHWLTVAAVVAQFVVGWTMPVDDDAADRAKEPLEHWLEKLLLTMLIVTPATGLPLVAGEDAWLPAHVAAQITLLALVAVHVGLVLSHTVVRRNRHLMRML